MKQPVTRCLLVALAVFALAMIAPRAATARVAVGTIQGVVLDTNGHPVPGATIIIQTSDGLQPNATHADTSGRFVFAPYATGQYDLRASHHGRYSEWMRRITIRRGKVTHITLRLTQTH